LAYTIFIQRKWQTALSTISEFNIPGTEIKGYFLECPGPDTETPNLNKRIPEGHYSLVWHASNKFAVHNPVPKLFNAKVPSSRAILIHPGNTPGDTQGCLLPGTERLIDKVTNSVIMYKKIKNILKKEGISKFNITITFCYVDGSR